MLVSRRFVIIAVAAFAFACGRKGPPLPPLHLVPTAPANISVARVGSEAQVRFDVPGTNQNGPGTVAIDHVEVFAATVAAGAIRPPNRDLLTSKYRIATIAIKPPPVEGEAPPDETTADTRPSPGQRTTFVEMLTDKTMEPVFTTPAPRPAAPAGRAATAPRRPPGPRGARHASVHLTAFAKCGGAARVHSAGAGVAARDRACACASGCDGCDRGGAFAAGACGVDGVGTSRRVDFAAFWRPGISCSHLHGSWRDEERPAWSTVDARRASTDRSAGSASATAGQRDRNGDRSDMGTG